VKPDVAWFNLGFASFGDRPLSAVLGLLTPAAARLNGVYSHVTLHQLFETVDLEDAAVSRLGCTAWEAGWRRICC
jgi:hypothetical protein